MLLAWPCLLDTGSEVIRGTSRVPCGDVGLSNKVPSEGPSPLSSAISNWDGLGFKAKTQKEPGYVFLGTTACKTGRGRCPRTCCTVAMTCTLPVAISDFGLVSQLFRAHDSSLEIPACICCRCAGPMSSSC